MVWKSKKHDPEFISTLLRCVSLDETTGKLTLNGIYGNVTMNFGWKGEVLMVPYSHVVWLLTKKKWPARGNHIHHLNHDPVDNRPGNLIEESERANQERRRGRMVYRSYGTGKYGYGFNIHHDKRDNRYYVRRHLSRGHGNGDLKGIQKGLGGFDTLQQAKKKIAQYIEEIKANGLDHMPVGPNAG